VDFFREERFPVVLAVEAVWVLLVDFVEEEAPELDFAVLDFAVLDFDLLTAAVAGFFAAASLLESWRAALAGTAHAISSAKPAQNIDTQKNAPRISAVSFNWKHHLKKASTCNFCKMKQPNRRRHSNDPPLETTVPVPAGRISVTEVYPRGRWFHPVGTIRASAPGRQRPGRSSGSTQLWRTLLRCSPLACSLPE
jgi:hypothetical protein